MTVDFSVKRAVVTGASGGIGEAIVRQLDRGGALGLVARSADRLESIASELTNDPILDQRVDRQHLVDRVDGCRRDE